MPRALRFLVPLGLLVLLMLSLPAVAFGEHQDDPRSSNVIPLGESFEPGSFLTTPAVANSDLAFWRNFAFEGSYDGFRVVDISDPNNPVEVADVLCNGQQGDLTVWRNILVRSVDRPQTLPNNDLSRACEGTDTPRISPPGTPARFETGFEGLQIFDISDIRNPRFIKAVPTDCGSHTHTQLVDRANNRLIIYVSRAGSAAFGGPTPYGTTCPEHLPVETAVEVPLGNPAAAQVVSNFPAGTNGCHDVAVFEEIKQMFGACRPNLIHWDISNPVNPTILHEMTHPAVTARQGPFGGWHSASLSWNGRILIGAWEPGGGGQAECEATDPPEEKSIFFYSASTGQLLGLWTLPRPQGPDENCTIHNYNVVPFKDRHVLVQGSYQSGWSAVNFTSPGAAFEFAWSDPPSLGPGPFCSQTRPPGCQLGGAWSTYWYNDLAVESDITTGLRLYTIRERWWREAFNMRRLNPQTQETLLRCGARITSPRTMRARQRTTVVVRVRERGGPAAGQPVMNQRVVLRGPSILVRTRTNSRGIARVAGLTARRAGTLRASVPTQLNMQGCTATKRIRAALQPRPAGERLTGARRS